MSRLTEWLQGLGAPAAPPPRRTSGGPPAAPPAAGRRAYTLATRRDVVDVQNRLTDLGLLDPPADGALGPSSQLMLRQAYLDADLPYVTTDEQLTAALNRAPRRLDLSRVDLAARLARATLARGAWFCLLPSCLNIVYVRSMSPDGTAHASRPNEFDDARFLLRVGADGVPVLAGAWEATVDPGRYWVEKRMNPAGAAQLDYGQWKAWRVGTHHDHEALVQVAPVRVLRDDNEDFRRDGDKPDTGMFGINQHWGYDLPLADLKNSSAGCLVGRTKAGHREFMALVKSDARYASNKSYVFMTTLLDAPEVV